METFLNIMLVIYFLSTSYYLYNLTIELIEWAETGTVTKLYIAASIFSFIGAFVPLFNTFISLRLLRIYLRK